jgi:signal transduction histidine kinase
VDYKEMEDILEKQSQSPAYYWVPYTLAILGTLISFFFWFVILTDLKVYFDFLHREQQIVPWVVLSFGISVSLLTAFIARTAILEKHHAHALDAINTDLKNEINNKQQLIDYKERIEKSLRQDQKLQAIGTLAGGIAHEFNNLLYAIVGYTEMAREDVKEESVTQQNLGKVLDAAKRGQDLIARILAFSRNQSQNQPFETLDLKKMIDGALALLRPTIPASVTIQYNALENLLIEGNPNQLQQVLVNLINNAVDAMDGVGDIDIQATTMPPNDPLPTEVGLLKGITYCKLIVRDTGTGMDLHTRERIFEPFFTTKEVGRGTGLGLAIVHSIIESHGGKVLVKSELGHGTSFLMFFPIITKER